MANRGKRALKRVGVVLLVLFAAVGALGYATFGGLKPLRPREFVPGIRVVKDGIVSIGVIDNGDGHLALIDCGNDATGKAILGDFEKNGLHADGVRTIFLTHGHGDHTKGCSLFPHASVVALEEEVPLVEGKVGSHGPVTRLFPARLTDVHVTHPAHDGERIDIGKRSVRVLAVPGHTPGSAAYVVDGILFLGDAAGITNQDQVRGPPWALSDDAAQGRESLRRLGARLTQEHEPVVALVPAHTGALDTPGVLGALAHVE